MEAETVQMLSSISLFGGSLHETDRDMCIPEQDKRPLSDGSPQIHNDDGSIGLNSTTIDQCPLNILQNMIDLIKKGELSETESEYQFTTCLLFLNHACSLRHIFPRRIKRHQDPITGNVVEMNSNCTLEPTQSEAVANFFAVDSAERHVRTTQVLKLCLECCFVFIASRRGKDCTQLVSRLQQSAFLPLLEECLNVGIVDMLHSKSLFGSALMLLHALNELGDSARPLFLHQPGESCSPQSKSILTIVEEIAALVKDFREKCAKSVTSVDEVTAQPSADVPAADTTVPVATAPPSSNAPSLDATVPPVEVTTAQPSGDTPAAGPTVPVEADAQKTPPAESHSTIFNIIQVICERICETRGNAAIALTPSSSSLPASSGSSDHSAAATAAAAAGAASSAAGTWRQMPSVVTWASPAAAHCNDGPPAAVAAEAVSEEELEREYSAAMSRYKVEGVVGLRSRHHFSAKGAAQCPARMARTILLELVGLQRSLPLGRREAAFVRYDEAQADFVSVLVAGGTGTPYAAGLFEFHVYFPPAYPDEPPAVRLVTTGRGAVRFNPNLYDDGLVCSSLLNQGSGWGNVVTWRSRESNLLEVVQSLMWVHMTADVVFAEPDLPYDAESEEGQAANEAYCDIVRYGNVRYAMLDNLRHPPEGFEDVVRDHFRLKRSEILAMVDGWLETARLGCVAAAAAKQKELEDAQEPEGDSELQGNDSEKDPPTTLVGDLTGESCAESSAGEASVSGDIVACVAEGETALPLHGETKEVCDGCEVASGRCPAPNYMDGIVLMHNQTLSDRFEQGFYYQDLKAAVDELRAELDKL